MREKLLPGTKSGKAFDWQDWTSLRHMMERFRSMKRAILFIGRREGRHKGRPPLVSGLAIGS
jgi:hypothetical protein